MAATRASMRVTSFFNTYPCNLQGAPACIKWASIVVMACPHIQHQWVLHLPHVMWLHPRSFVVGTLHSGLGQHWALAMLKISVARMVCTAGHSKPGWALPPHAMHVLCLHNPHMRVPQANDLQDGDRGMQQVAQCSPPLDWATSTAHTGRGRACMSHTVSVRSASKTPLQPWSGQCKGTGPPPVHSVPAKTPLVYSEVRCRTQGTHMAWASRAHDGTSTRTSEVQHAQQVPDPVSNRGGGHCRMAWATKAYTAMMSGTMDPRGMLSTAIKCHSRSSPLEGTPTLHRLPRMTWACWSTACRGRVVNTWMGDVSSTTRLARGKAVFKYAGNMRMFSLRSRNHTGLVTKLLWDWGGTDGWGSLCMHSMVHPCTSTRASRMATMSKCPSGWRNPLR